MLSMPASREQTEFEPYYIKRDRPVTYMTSNSSLQTGTTPVGQYLRNITTEYSQLANPIYNNKAPLVRPIAPPRKSLENLSDPLGGAIGDYIEPVNYVEPRLEVRHQFEFITNS